MDSAFTRGIWVLIYTFKSCRWERTTSPISTIVTWKPSTLLVATKRAIEVRQTTERERHLHELPSAAYVEMLGGAEAKHKLSVFPRILLAETRRDSCTELQHFYVQTWACSPRIFVYAPSLHRLKDGPSDVKWKPRLDTYLQGRRFPSWPGVL